MGLMMKRLGRIERTTLAEILLSGKTRANSGIVGSLVNNGLIVVIERKGRDTVAKATPRGRELFAAPADVQR